MEINCEIFKIFDNFLNDNEIKILTNIINNKLWSYNTTSGNSEIINTFFGNHKLEESFFMEYLKSKIDSEINNFLYICTCKTPTCNEVLSVKSYPECRREVCNCLKQKYTIQINRMYMHMQNYGEDGCYHCDDIGKDKLTFCIYLNDINHDEIENASGELFLKIPKKKNIICIDSYFNRAILFQSEYLHKGMAYKKYHNKRICITWKLQLIEMK